MFSKKQRINREKIGEIFKKPDFSFNSNNFSVKTSKNNLPHPRFAVVVSKKTEKSAVKRHFLKRKIISFIKKQNTNKNIDIIFVLKNNIANQDDKSIKNEIANLLDKCIID